MKRRKFAQRALPERHTEPFVDAEEAWFWYMDSQARRLDGVRFAGSGDVERPCDPDDIYKALMGLWRRRRLHLHHLRILRAFGAEGRPPDSRVPSEESAARFWDEALDLLLTPLRRKGIVQ